MTDNFVCEAHVLARKLRQKERLMRYGSGCFRLALIALAGVAAGPLSPAPVLYWVAFLVPAGCLAAVYAAIAVWRD